MVAVSRRALLGAAAGASAAALPGCGNPRRFDPFKASIVENDGRLLNQLLELEYSLGDAYAALLPALSSARAALVERLAAQEDAHAVALLAELQRLGLVAPAAPPARPRRPPAVGGAGQALAYAARLENMAVAAYIDVLPKLAGAPARAVATAILVSESEHLALVERLAGRSPLRQALVWGRA